MTVLKKRPATTRQGWVEEQLLVVEAVAKAVDEWAAGMGGETRTNFETVAQHIRTHSRHIVGV